MVIEPNQVQSPETSRPPARSSRSVHRDRLITALSNPDLEAWPKRTEYYEILELSAPQAIYKIFSPEDLDAIEATALALVRRRYSRSMRDVDRHVLRRAQGDGRTASADAKLAYQRLEGWEPGERLTLGGGLQVVEIVARFELGDGQQAPQPVQVVEAGRLPAPEQPDDYQPPEPPMIEEPETLEPEPVMPAPEPDPYPYGLFSDDPTEQARVEAKIREQQPPPPRPVGRPKGSKDSRPRRSRDRRR